MDQFKPGTLILLREFFEKTIDGAFCRLKFSNPDPIGILDGIIPWQKNRKLKNYTKRHRMKILVVDDEKDIQQLFEQRFRKEIKSGEFYFVFTFSGADALQYLSLEHHEVVLILSDINMPGMSGFELLSEIKKKFTIPPPVVMMITAYGDDEKYRQSIELGADDFLTKPLDFNLLKSKLKSLE